MTVPRIIARYLSRTYWEIALDALVIVGIAYAAGWIAGALGLV